METDSFNLETRPLISRTTRQSCFICKRSLDDMPYAYMILYILLGFLTLVHFWVSMILLYAKLSSNTGEYYNIFLPALIFCAEICFVCLTVFVLILSDFFTRKVRGITLWQRQAIGRLMRDFIIFLQIGLTASFLYSGIDSDGKLSDTLWQTLLPGLILSAMAGTRFLLIQSDESLFWIGLSFLVIAQQSLFICKIDVEMELSWICCLIPLYLICLDFTGLSIYYFMRAARELDYSNMILSLFGMIGSVFTGIGILFSSFYLDGMNDLSLAAIWVGIGLGISSISLIKPLGLFILDIAVGHIEIEILELKYPVLSLQNAPHSV